MRFLSVDAYLGPYPSRIHRSSKQFKALQDKLNVQQFVVTDEMATASSNRTRRT